MNSRTQVVIVGAGSSGPLLGRLLQRGYCRRRFMWTRHLRGL